MENGASSHSTAATAMDRDDRQSDRDGRGADRDDKGGDRRRGSDRRDGHGQRRRLSRSRSRTPGHEGRGKQDRPRERSRDRERRRHRSRSRSSSRGRRAGTDRRDDRRGRGGGEGGNAPEPAAAAAAAAAAAGSGRSVPRSMLSFGDELEDGSGGDAGAQQGGGGAEMSLAESTAHRFKTEKELKVVNSMAAEPPSQRVHDDDAPSPPNDAAAATAGVATASAFGGGGAGGGRASLGQLRFGVATARGARPYMEDRHSVVSSLTPVNSLGQLVQDGVFRSFAAVFDGHNGTKAAEHAMTRLQQLLAAEPAVRTCTGDGPPSMDAQEEEHVAAAMKRAFHTVDGEILADARVEELRDGATAVCMLRLGDVLYTAHAGDSRAVLCRGQVASRLTEDHKPDLPTERGRVELLGGRVEFQRCWRIISEPRPDRPLSGLAVSRSFGDLDFKEPRRYVECEPDVGRVRLAPGDRFVVLASDGLWDVLSDQDAVNIVQAVLDKAPSQQQQQPGGGCGGGSIHEGAAKEAAEQLVQSALQRGTLDNVTALVGLMHWS